MHCPDLRTGYLDTSRKFTCPKDPGPEMAPTGKEKVWLNAIKLALRRLMVDLHAHRYVTSADQHFWRFPDVFIPRLTVSTASWLLLRVQRLCDLQLRGCSSVSLFFCLWLQSESWWNLGNDGKSKASCGFWRWRALLWVVFIFGSFISRVIFMVIIYMIIIIIIVIMQKKCLVHFHYFVAECPRLGIWIWMRRFLMPFFFLAFFNCWNLIRRHSVSSLTLLRVK